MLIARPCCITLRQQRSTNDQKFINPVSAVSIGMSVCNWHVFMQAMSRVTVIELFR